MNDESKIYKEYWTEVYNRCAPTYDHVGPRFFSHFGQRLVELAEVGRGATVLDLGCGRGAILFPAAQVVGPSGKVIGVDLAEEMVTRTAKAIRQSGLTNAEARRMDAEALDFPDAFFDFVFCGFALYAFFDANKALAEAFRVLKPSGVFAQSLWGRELDPRWDGFRKMMKGYAKQLRPAPEGGISSRSDSAEIQALLTKAGFVNIQTVTEEQEFYLKDEGEFWEFDRSNANRDFYERLEPSVRRQLKHEIFAMLGQMKQESGIPIMFQMLLTRAYKP